MAISRQECNQITAEIETAIREVLASHGLDLVIKSANYGEGYGLKLEGVAQAEDGATFNPNTREARTLAAHAEFYGLPTDALGREFSSGGKRFVVTGLNTRASKMPVQAKCLTDGRDYKFSPESVARLLTLASASA